MLCYTHIAHLICSLLQAKVVSERSVVLYSENGKCGVIQ
jgi:hypothetical protein